MRRSPLAFLTLSLLACAIGAGAAATATAPALPDLMSYALMRNQGGVLTTVSVDQAAGVLQDYDVIFLGELHDHTGNHLAQMALLRALHGRAPNLALSMEQFERDVQPVVDEYLAGKIGEDALRRRGRAWPNYRESYRPLVEFAKENGLPVIAANAPASVVRCVGQEGPEFLARLAPEKRGWAAAELNVAEGTYRDKFVRFLREDRLHGDEADAVDRNAPPSAAELRGYASQVTRDDTMAESIFLEWQKNPGRKIVHTAGAFHVAGSLGTVERLKTRAPDLKIAVIVPVEATDPSRPEWDAASVNGNDFAVLLKAGPKEYASEEEEKAAIEQIRRTIRGRTTTQTRCEA